MAYLIELKEVKAKDVPPKSYQLWNPAFKHKTLEQVEKETKEYYHVYNYGVFCRETGTIHLYISCPHTESTFNNDAGVMVCDDCNNRLNRI